MRSKIIEVKFWVKVQTALERNRRSSIYFRS